MNKDIGNKSIKVKPILIVGGVVMGMILILFLATKVLPKALITLTQANTPGKVVINGSYLIGEKILAKADGKDSCLVNVFLLDKNGKGVKGQMVELIGMNDIETINSMSDDFGKVGFKLTSTVEKQYKINAVYSGAELPQTIVVTFR